VNPGAPVIPEQDFFTMGEACRIAQVPAHILRYWERQLGFPRPARRASGHRRYGRADLETVFEIKRLLVGRGMTMAGARKALLEQRRGIRSADAGESAAAPATVRLLREVRAELRELASELAK
jgi:DNA-binding transcriptional MerR regulator